MYYFRNGRPNRMMPRRSTGVRTMLELDLKRRKTYHALIQAFEELMREKSIDDLSVQELCQKAAIGRNTFYSHFEDKYAFFQYYISLQREFLEEASSVPGDSFLQYRIRVAENLFRYFKENRFIWEKNIKASSAWILRDMIKNNVKAPLLEEMEKAEKNTGKTFPVSKELLASFYASGIIEIYTECLYNDRISESEVLRDLEEICSRLFQLS